MMRASHTYFVLKLLGYPNLRGDDRSWPEWGTRNDTARGYWGRGALSGAR